MKTILKFNFFLTNEMRAPEATNGKERRAVEEKNEREINRLVQEVQNLAS